MDNNDRLENSRRNLASIFKSDVTGHDAGPPSIAEGNNVSFATNNVMTSQNENSQLAPVITQKVVQCFKFENNQWKNEGIVNAAILHSKTLPRILCLYKEKKKMITSAQITDNFLFKIQSSTKSESQSVNNHALFRDYNNIVWSLVFNTLDDQISFSIEIAFARWFSMEIFTGIISQDLLISNNDDKIKIGEPVHIIYIAWPLQSTKQLQKESESKGTLTVNLSFEKHWENALTGIANGGKRALIIPAFQLGEWEKTIGRKCRNGLFLQISLEKCSPIERRKSVELVLPVLPNFGSSDEQKKYESKRKKTKSKEELIERLGKLGKPLPSVSKYDSDESEDDSSSVSSGSVKPKRAVHKTKYKSDSQVVGWPTMSGLPGDQFLIPASGNSYPLMTTLHQPQPVFSAHAQVSDFISDQRAHNAELRLAQTGAVNKLDQLVETTSSRAVDKLIEEIKRIEQNMLGHLSLIQDECRPASDTPNIGNPATVLQESIDNECEKMTMEELVIDNNRIRHVINEKCSEIDNLKSEIDMLTSSKQELENELLAEKKSTEELQKVDDIHNIYEAVLGLYYLCLRYTFNRKVDPQKVACGNAPLFEWKVLPSPLKYHKIDCSLQEGCDCEDLEQVECMKYLGVWVDSKLSWKSHIAYLKEKMATIKSLQEKLNNPYDFVHDAESSMEEWATRVLTLENSLNRLSAETKGDTATESSQVMEEMNHLYKLLKSEFNYDDGHVDKLPVARVRNIFQTFFKDCMKIEEDKDWSGSGTVEQ